MRGNPPTAGDTDRPASPDPGSPALEPVDRVLQIPYEVLDYQRWIREQASSTTGPRDYLFSEDKPRFEPRKDDVVVAHPSLQVRERAGVARLVVDEGAAEVELPGVSRSVAQRILDAIDGARCLAQVRWKSGAEPPVFARFLRAAFGRVVFSPAAVESLDSRLSSIELVRFPSSPYALQRPYWENMIAVREHFLARWHDVSDAPGFLLLLRRLHVLSLMGPRLDSFYKPASPGADRAVAPGALLSAPARILPTAEGNLFLDGPRVNVSWLGGTRWHSLIRGTTGQNPSLDDAQEFSESGLPWGRVVVARAEHDDGERPWFCPPRPISEQHVEFLWRELSQAQGTGPAGDREAAVAALARFHQGFVRLHPFHCANQCLAMNLVNAQLARLTGAGIPHLVLDHLALRLPTLAYEEVFRRAVHAFSLPAELPARRLAVLRERRLRSFALIDRLASCPSDREARSILDADPDAACWALVRAPEA